MPTPTSPTENPRFPFLARVFHWIFSWRTLGRVLIGFGALGTFTGLFYVKENWRGRRAWEQYRHGFETRGMQLDYHALVPKPVPDEQNFAATSTVQTWFEKPADTGPESFQRTRDDFWLASNSLSSRMTSRSCMDLSAWDRAFVAVRSGKLDSNPVPSTRPLTLNSRVSAAPAVLDHLKTNDAMFAELRAASRRPFARYPIIYDLENPWGILLPHLARIKDVCLRLQLKACAELAVGRSENALEDVKLLLFMTDSVKEEPFLISYLVRLECLRIAIQPVWEGLTEHRWSEAQLKELQKRFLSYNFVADLQRALGGEPAAAILTADLLFKGKYRLSQLADVYGTSDPMSESVARFAPHGWFYMDQLNYCRLFSILFGTGIDAAKKQILPRQIESNRREFEGLLSPKGSHLRSVIHHQALAGFLLPDLCKAPLKSAQAQTLANQAALACALEQYRLSTGQFPETLEALSPRFISSVPKDVVNGEAYHYYQRAKDDGFYRRAGDARFVLYSVGWNGKDDGGKVFHTGLPGHVGFPSPGFPSIGDWNWANRIY